MELLEGTFARQRLAEKTVEGARLGGHLTYGEKKRRAEREESRPDWLRTSNKALDARGRRANLWDSADDFFSKNNVTLKTKAEREANYAFASASRRHASTSFSCARTLEKIGPPSELSPVVIRDSKYLEISPDC